MLVKALWKFLPELRRVSEARHVLGESLNGIPEKLLYELVKVKPGLHWRPCDFRGNRAVGYLLWRSVYRE